MYWYNIKLLLSFPVALLCGILLLQSCAESDATNASENTSEYYAVHAFFKKEVDSLQHHNPIVQKTVGKDDDQETKVMHIKDWNAELGAFLSIDLSKAAYQDMYEVDSTAQQITYTAKSDEVDIQSLSIDLDAVGQVSAMKVVRNESNFLYQNKEQLSYVRGKEYSILKEQHILLLGTNKYQIVSNFNTK